MKPAPFHYYTPKSVDEALLLLSQHDDAKILAGGQSLIPAMNFRLAQPSMLIDINGIDDLSYIDYSKLKGVISIGAMSRHADIEHSDIVAKHIPLLHEAMPHIAHPQIRNRGTIGGSIAHADPAAELPCILIALDASIIVKSQQEEKAIKAHDFFTGLFETVVGPKDLVTRIDIPIKSKRTGYCFKEVARRSGDFAMVGLSARITLSMFGKISDAQVVFFNVSDTPVISKTIAQALIGQKFSKDLVEQCSFKASKKDIEPNDDLHASSSFRRKLAFSLANQALTCAYNRARNERFF